MLYTHTILDTRISGRYAALILGPAGGWLSSRICEPVDHTKSPPPYNHNWLSLFCLFVYGFELPIFFGQMGCQQFQQTLFPIIRLEGWQPSVSIMSPKFMPWAKLNNSACS